MHLNRSSSPRALRVLQTSPLTSVRQGCRPEPQPHRPAPGPRVVLPPGQQLLQVWPWGAREGWGLSGAGPRWGAGRSPRGRVGRGSRGAGPRWGPRGRVGRGLTGKGSSGHWAGSLGGASVGGARWVLSTQLARALSRVPMGLLVSGCRHPCSFSPSNTFVSNSPANPPLPSGGF